MSGTLALANASVPANQSAFANTAADDLAVGWANASLPANQSAAANTSADGALASPGWANASFPANQSTAANALYDALARRPGAVASVGAFFRSAQFTAPAPVIGPGLPPRSARPAAASLASRTEFVWGRPVVRKKRPWWWPWR